MNCIHSWSTSQLDLKYIQRCSNTRGEAMVSASGRGELNRRNEILESFHYPYVKYWRWSENNRVLRTTGIFPTQGWNPGFLHCRQILYYLSYQGSQRQRQKAKTVKQKKHLNEEMNEKYLQRPQKDFLSSPSQSEWSFLPEMPLHLPFLLEAFSFFPLRPLAHLENRQSGAREYNIGCY